MMMMQGMHSGHSIWPRREGATRASHLATPQTLQGTHWSKRSHATVLPPAVVQGVWCKVGVSRDAACAAAARRRDAGGGRGGEGEEGRGMERKGDKERRRKWQRTGRYKKIIEGR